MFWLLIYLPPIFFNASDVFSLHNISNLPRWHIIQYLNFTFNKLNTSADHFCRKRHVRIENSKSYRIYIVFHYPLLKIKKMKNQRSKHVRFAWTHRFGEFKGTKREVTWRKLWIKRIRLRRITSHLVYLSYTFAEKKHIYNCPKQFFADKNGYTVHCEYCLM